MVDVNNYLEHCRHIMRLTLNSVFMVGNGNSAPRLDMGIYLI